MVPAKERCLVYLADNFQDLEFVATLASLKRSNLFELHLKGNLPEARELSGQYGFVKVLVEPLERGELGGYDSLFVVGGAHCQALRLDPLFKEAATHFYNHNLPVYAICDGPNVLYELGLIREDEHYTSYNIQTLKAGGGREGEREVITHTGSRLLVTGRDPAAAYAFGLAVVEAAKREEG